MVLDVAPRVMVLWVIGIAAAAVAVVLLLVVLVVYLWPVLRPDPRPRFQGSQTWRW